MGVGSTDMAPQRDLEFVGRCLGRRKADAENGVRSDPALVVGAVGGDQFGVDKPLVDGVEADDRVGEFAVDEANRSQHALAVESIAAIAQLDRFERAGGGARGHDRPADGTRIEADLHLDGGIAARVEDLTTVDVLNGAHDGTTSQCANGQNWAQG